MSINKSTEGYVYIFTNVYMPNICKIGVTKRHDVKQRSKELSTPSGVPYPFECEYACVVKNCKEVEKMLHKVFDMERINPKKEFFTTAPNRIQLILEQLKTGGELIKEATKEIKAEMDKNMTADDREAVKKFKRKMRPKFNFQIMGIKEGDSLVFTENSEIKVIVVSENKIKYNNELLTLTNLTVKLKNPKHSIAPLSYWTYNGVNCQDIYNKVYSNNSKEK